MKKYILELILCILQVALFYVYPLYMKQVGAIGVVIVMLVSTLLLGLIMGALSNKKMKFLFPVFVAIVFLPTIYIYYNESALVHSVWYLVVSAIGLVLGIIFRRVIRRR